jgi:REP element-mobilizing transposase RayT
MARPLRIELPAALYHVTSRGDRRELTYDDDREVFLSTLVEVIGQMTWLCHGYCLMTNHYHVLIAPTAISPKACGNSTGYLPRPQIEGIDGAANCSMAG